MTKHELDERLTFLAALKDKLPSLTVSPEEAELLEELLEAQQEREALAWRHERAEQVVDCLFPTWRGGRIEKPKHPIWHEKSWWWNGARIEDLVGRTNGDVVVTLKSYVGCGDTDTIHDLVLKREWLEADDSATVVRAYTEGVVARNEAMKRQQEMARAQADLAAAQARLNEMKGA